MYQLMIRPFSAPEASLFKFEKFEDAVLAAHAAMENGFHMSPRFSVILGDGSLLNVMSDESITKSAGKERNVVLPDDFVLHIQFGLVQLPPLTYKDEESRDEALEIAVKTGRLTYVFERVHDILYMMLGSGTMLVAITGEEFLEKRREAIEMHRQQMEAIEMHRQKLLAEQEQKTEHDNSARRIILPPGMR